MARCPVDNMAVTYEIPKGRGALIKVKRLNWQKSGPASAGLSVPSFQPSNIDTNWQRQVGRRVLHNILVHMAACRDECTSLSKGDLASDA